MAIEVPLYRCIRNARALWCDHLHAIDNLKHCTYLPLEGFDCKTTDLNHIWLQVSEKFNMPGAKSSCTHKHALHDLKMITLPQNCMVFVFLGKKETTFFDLSLSLLGTYNDF